MKLGVHTLRHLKTLDKFARLFSTSEAEDPIRLEICKVTQYTRIHNLNLVPICATIILP